MLKRWYYSLIISAIIATVSACIALTLFLVRADGTFPNISHSLFHIPEQLDGPFQFAAPWDAELFTGYLADGEVYALVTSTYIYGGIIPHHLHAGYIAGAFFESISSQDIDTIILIGPNHFNRGFGPVATTYQHWDTPFGTVATQRGLVDALLDTTPLVHVEEDVIAEEHSVYSLVPFIAATMPEVRILSLTLSMGMQRKDLDLLVASLTELQTEKTVIIGSVDFSHYQPAPVADFHDDLSEIAIREFDYDTVLGLEVDSPETIYTVLKLMESAGAQKVPHIIRDNSAYISDVPDSIETTSYVSPYFVRGPKAESTQQVTVLHVGDMMIDRAVALQIGRYGIDWLIEPLQGEEDRFFSGIDRIVGNLEGPFADVRIDTTKSIAFRFDPILAQDLKRWGIDIVTLANNHSQDMGRQGVTDTLRHLDDVGIAYLGQQFAVNSSSLYIDTVRDLDIAYVAINDTHPGTDIDTALKLIAQAEIEADTTIVTIHWGQEYQLLSNTRQRELAHKFIDLGADVVIGHHPHVVQEVEVYKDKPIFYSLGNFLFDQYFSTDTQQGLAIGLVLAPGRVEKAYIYPLEMNRSQVSYMSYTARQSFMQALLERSRLGAYTIDTFNTINFSYETN